MKTESECNALAKAKLEEYVNACQCNSKSEVLQAIEKMGAMALFAHDVVDHGEKAPLNVWGHWFKERSDG